MDTIHQSIREWSSWSYQAEAEINHSKRTLKEAYFQKIIISNQSYCFVKTMKNPKQHKHLGTGNVQGITNYKVIGHFTSLIFYSKKALADRRFLNSVRGSFWDLETTCYKFRKPILRQYCIMPSSPQSLLSNYVLIYIQVSSY